MLKQVKILTFKGNIPSLAPGIQFVTIRRYRKWIHDLTQNDVFLGQFEIEVENGNGLKIGCLLLQAIYDTEKILFSKFTKQQAKKCGYAGPKVLFNKLKKKYYPNLEQTDTAAIIRYKVLRRPVGTIYWEPPK